MAKAKFNYFIKSLTTGRKMAYPSDYAYEKPEYFDLKEEEFDYSDFLQGYCTLSIGKDVKTPKDVIEGIQDSLCNTKYFFVDSIFLSDKNTEFELRENGKCLVHKSTNTLCFAVNNHGRYKIPDDVTSIAYAGLRYANYYSPVVIPKQITHLPRRTFEGAKINYIYIDGALTDSYGAFSGIKQVKMIVAGNTNPSIFSSYGTRIAAVKGFPKAYYDGNYDINLLTKWNRFIKKTLIEAIERNDIFPLHENVKKYLTESNYFSEDFLSELSDAGFFKKPTKRIKTKEIKTDHIASNSNNFEDSNFISMADIEEKDRFIDSIKNSISKRLLNLKFDEYIYEPDDKNDIMEMLKNSKKYKIDISGDQKDFSALNLKIISMSKSEIKTVYAGSAPYSVSLYSSNGVVHGKCSCPSFAKNKKKSCKHICGLYNFFKEIYEYSDDDFEGAAEELLNRLDARNYKLMKDKYIIDHPFIGSNLEVVLVDSHRLWLMDNSDKIYVIEAGDIIFDGMIKIIK